LPQSRSRSWFPPEVRINTGRLCSAGSACHTFPGFNAPMRPSDSHFPVGLGCGSPRLRPTPRRTLLLGRGPRASADACLARGLTFAGSPIACAPADSWREMGLPGFWAVLLLRAAIRKPRRSPRHLTLWRWRRCCLQVDRNPGQAAFHFFGARLPRLTRSLPTHRRTGCPLRRKARFRPAGLGFDRAGFEPAGRQTGFQVVIASPSFRTRMSWSHLSK